MTTAEKVAAAASAREGDALLQSMTRDTLTKFCVLWGMQRGFPDGKASRYAAIKDFLDGAHVESAILAVVAVSAGNDGGWATMAEFRDALDQCSLSGLDADEVIRVLHRNSVVEMRDGSFRYIFKRERSEQEQEQETKASA